MSDFALSSVADLAAEIPDGAQVAIPVDYAGSPTALIHAIAQRRTRDLRLVCVPTGGYGVDLLIGAGCVAEIETSGISLGEFGLAPRFRDAVAAGAFKLKDATCPAIHAELQAGQKGIPYMPLRGIVGSDLLRYRDDWLLTQNPYAEGEDPLVLLPALRPDFALLHAALVDGEGNVWVGRRGELRTMAHAAEGSLVTAEAFYDGNLLEEDTYAAGTIPSIYVHAAAIAEQGAWPCAFWYGEQPVDAGQMRRYAELARTPEGFESYLDELFQNREAAA